LPYVADAPCVVFCDLCTQKSSLKSHLPPYKEQLLDNNCRLRSTKS